MATIEDRTPQSLGRDVQTILEKQGGTEHLFSSYGHAREIIKRWRIDCNTVRPHSSLGNMTPSEFLGEHAHNRQRSGSFELDDGSTIHPVAHRLSKGHNGIGANL